MHFIDNVLIHFKRSTAKAQARWYKARLGACGGNLTIQNDAVFTDPESTFIGNDVYINFHCVFMSAPSAVIRIGNHVLIGPNSTFITVNHAIDHISSSIDTSKKYVNAPIVIEDNVWIGANVTVLPGVVIHTGAVVGAGSTVTHDVPSNTIVAGVPAKVIRKRKAR